MTSFPRSFWLYLGSRFCTATAMTLLRAAVAWHVYALSQTAFHLGLIGLIQFLPVPALMLLGGALADTHDRRRLMMIAQALPLAASAVLLVATHTGSVRLPLLYGMVVVTAVAWAIDSPARAALLPTLVRRERFPRAVTLASTNQALAFATGPALGGAAIAAAGIEAAYALYGILLILALGMLLLLETPPQERGAGRVTLRAIAEGLRFVRGNQVVLGCMLLDMFAVIFGGASALLPIYAHDILQVGAPGYGLLSSSLELGALAMSFALTLLPPIRRAGRALLATVAVYGCATIVFGASRWFPLSILAYVVVGMADQVSVVLRSTAIQLSTPDALRGRVSGVNMIFIGASNQLGAAESGFLAHWTSPTFSVVSGGLMSLLVVAAVATRMPALRRYQVQR